MLIKVFKMGAHSKTDLKVHYDSFWACGYCAVSGTGNDAYIHQSKDYFANQSE